MEFGAMNADFDGEKGHHGALLRYFLLSFLYVSNFGIYLELIRRETPKSGSDFPNDVRLS